MKLYSKHQVILASLCSAFLVGLIAAGFWLFYKQPLKLTSQESQTEIISETPQDDTFIFETAFVSDSSLTSDTEGYTQDELQNINVYERCSDAVVNISTKVITYSWFYEPYPTDGGTGSGSIIDKRGYVVTNRHVIKDAYEIYISLSDGTQYKGTLIGQDEMTDIAVIKFDPPKEIALKTIGFSDSSNLKVGQKVIAIGNPFGFDRTMTTGIISSLGRPVQSNNTIIKDMIQTDTAINPGNSGGPLLDTKGKMIGINTMIYSTSGSSAGVGFAVPVNTAKRIVSDLIQHGKVIRGSLDASLIQLSQSIVQYANLPVSQGLLVSQIKKGGNAEKAGIKGGTEAVQYGSRRSPQVFYIGGDIITAVNGSTITSVADYNAALENTKPGQQAFFTVIRGKEQIDFRVTLSESKE